MRLRNIPEAKGYIEDSPYCINEFDAKDLKGQWNKVFNNENPIYIEIGTGKGQFLINSSLAHKDVNYIGMERYESVLYKAVRKLERVRDEEDEAFDNIRFLCADARDLEEMFDPGELKKVYLNFSDPWPKDRHAKRRLTSPGFLTLYRKLLPKEGVLEFKTDNDDLFAYSCETIKEEQGWVLDEYTDDLHNDKMGTNNIMTEYEEKFSEKGKKINKLIAHTVTGM